jgi:hypothetical protein
MRRTSSIALLLIMLAACGRSQPPKVTPIPPDRVVATIVVVDAQQHPIPTAFLRFKWPEDPGDLHQAASRSANTAGEITLDLLVETPDMFTMKELLILIEAPGYAPYTYTLLMRPNGRQTTTITLTTESP